MKTFVITAGRTSDGAPVYLSEDGSWSTTLAGSKVFDSESAAQESLAVAKRQEAIVCDPGLFKVRREADTLRPLTAKSRLRLESAEDLLARLGYFDTPDLLSHPAKAGV